MPESLQEPYQHYSDASDQAVNTSSLSSNQHSSNANTLTSIKVIKRNGSAVLFDESKINAAMTKAFLAAEDSSSGSARMRDSVSQITSDIVARIKQKSNASRTIYIEDIQDLVELGLMRSGFQKVARAYVIYRETHAAQRQKDQRSSRADNDESNAKNLKTVTDDGTEVVLYWSQVVETIAQICEQIKAAEPKLIEDSISKVLYSGMRQEDVGNAMIMAVRPLIEREPAYSFVCAQLLLKDLRSEVCQSLNVAEDDYSAIFIQSIKQCTRYELLTEDLQQFDLDQLAEALLPENDQQFTYLGLQTLYDRYFLHWEEKRLELPQVFFMRVAMGLALQENDKNARAIEFYQQLSSFDYMVSTPTLFNSASRRSQLSSCFLTTVPDDLAGIYGALKDNAMLSKWAGGLGNDWTPVRALGARINGTNGQSQGVVPFLKVVNDTAVAVNQGGKRKGAVCGYLETWHLDVEAFLELRKNTGDERRRTHDMNSANWIPDLFMKRVNEDGDWTLFSPSDTPDLHDLYGAEFEHRYTQYEQQVEAGTIKLFRQIKAKDLWRKMLAMLFETGHPWITFKDTCNIRSPQQHVGVVHSSNLCTEITLNTSADEIAVCNLGSVNLAKHIKDGQLDTDHLKRTVQTAVRMLDNVVDINFYAVPQAKQSNLKHRPVGMGLMGFQDALYALDIAYGSIEAVQFADESMELISYYAIEASALLAKERGAYDSYDGSLWDQGVLPIDSISLLEKNRGASFFTMDKSVQLDWQPIRDLIKAHGMRNSNLLAIAPTATISNIVGVTQSIEPTYQNIFVKSNLSGEFTVINPALVDALKALSLWDDLMIDDLKYYDGSLGKIDRIPDELKERFSTAFEIDPRWLIEAASRRQKWIDQAQSLNIYLAEPSGKKLDNIYQLAWSRGLKTTYYLRSLGASQMEQTTERTTDQSANDLGQEEPVESVAFCGIDDPECEACQ